MQFIGNIIIGQYYIYSKRDYDTAKYYYDEASKNMLKYDKYASLLHYVLSTYYYRKNDILQSLYYSDLALKGFAEKRNIRKLINVKMTTSLQYFEMRYFTKALEINLENLKEIKQLNLELEKRILSNNIAFIYHLMGDYTKAIEYYSQMPEAYMNEQHFYSYASVLLIMQDYEKAQELCEKGLEIASSKYYKTLLTYLYQFFEHKDLKKLTKQLIRVYNKYADELMPITKEELLCLIVETLKQSNQHKKALFYMEEKYKLTYK